MLTAVKVSASDSISEKTFARGISVTDASSSTVTLDIGFVTEGVSFKAFTVTVNVLDTDNAGVVFVSVAVTTTVVFPLALAT